MKTLYAVLAGGCLALAGISSCNVMVAESSSLGQVCLMLFAVCCVGVAQMCQRAAYRWAKIQEKEDAEVATKAP